MTSSVAQLARDADFRDVPSMTERRERARRSHKPAESFYVRSEAICSQLVTALHAWNVFNHTRTRAWHTWSLEAGYYSLYHVALLPGLLIGQRTLHGRFTSAVGGGSSPTMDARHQELARFWTGDVQSGHIADVRRDTVEALSRDLRIDREEFDAVLKWLGSELDRFRVARELSTYQPLVVAHQEVAGARTPTVLFGDDVIRLEYQLQSVLDDAIGLGAALVARHASAMDDDQMGAAHARHLLDEIDAATNSQLLSAEGLPPTPVAMLGRLLEQLRTALEPIASVADGRYDLFQLGTREVTTRRKVTQTRLRAQLRKSEILPIPRETLLRLWDSRA